MNIDIIGIFLQKIFAKFCHHRLDQKNYQPKTQEKIDPN